MLVMGLGRFSPTLIRLVLAGFVLVALPLVVAIVTAIVDLSVLAQESQQALLTVQAGTNRTRALSDRVLDMERSARQFQALGDDTYRNLFHEHHRSVEALLVELTANANDEDTIARLERCAALTGSLVRHIEALARGETVQELQAEFAELRELVLAITQDQNARARALANAMPEQASDLQRLLLSQGAFVIPLSVGLAGLFVILISRPLRQLDHAIRTLGRGTLSEPVAVSGTRDLAELGQRLEWLRIRLAELEAQKSVFLRNVSHELKTPLTNIRESVTLLAEGEAEAEERQAIVDILLSNSLRLQRMIEELLQFGADGEMDERVAHTRLDLAQLVEELLEIHTPAMQARGIELRSRLTPCETFGSAKRIKVVVDNLLSNAIKHTPSGGRIEVVLGVREHQVTLRVHDSGPGVRPQDAPRLYDWFFTGPKPKGALVAGTGMGLAIAQEYAQQHGGEVVLLDSATGAHFELSLPGERT